MTSTDRLVRANECYERAVFGGDAGALETGYRELDAVEADVALARGRLLHARFLESRQEDPRELALFERAAQLYRELGDIRGEGEALFWVGTFHQVVRQDAAQAGPAHQRAYELAAQAGDNLTLSYAARHLGFADQHAGRTARARERFEESIRLRREIDFQPGVAAGLLALAGVVVGADERAALLDEAGSIAESCGADRVRQWIAQAREQ